MNAERLLAHFEQISEAPDAIARLRRFILDLAVRGKLVEQDPEDEPAEEELAELIKQRELACAAEGLRTRKPITPLERKSLWFEFPFHWSLCSFDDALVIVSGVTKGQRIPLGEKSIEIPYLRVANVQRGWLDLSEVKTITVRSSDVERYRLADQDILMTEGGDWDKLGRAAIWRGEISNCIHQNHIFRLRIPGDTILPQWIILYANSDCGRRFFEDSSKQTTNLASINLTQLRSCPLPLPPLAEQHRIVAKVDELMALCDQLEAARQQREQTRERLVAASLQRLNQPAEDPTSFRQHAGFALQTLPSLTTTPAQIKQLRQCILNLAVRGKLVEQDPEDEPAEELLRCITRHKKPFPQASCDKSSLPFDLPTGWVHTTLRTLVESSSSGWSPKTLDASRKGDEWGILKVSAVSWDQFRPEANKQVLPGTEPRLQAVIRKDDFLISRANTAELVARAVIVENEPVNLMMSDKIVRLDLVELCEPKYILINNNHSSFSRSYYAERATGVSPSMKNVTRDVILDLPIPLPPLAEQHRIVAKVDELMALCDQLEQQLSQADQKRRRLLEALLAEAFRAPEKALASVGSA